MSGFPSFNKLKRLNRRRIIKMIWGFLALGVPTLLVCIPYINSRTYKKVLGLWFLVNSIIWFIAYCSYKIVELLRI